MQANNTIRESKKPSFEGFFALRLRHRHGFELYQRVFVIKTDVAARVRALRVCEARDQTAIHVD